MPRQRILVRYLKKFLTTQSHPLETLYFAPDPSGQIWLKRHPQFSTTTTDLSAPNVDKHWDITDLPAKDASYDVILCSHVLEHIPDDRKAMSEMYRVLKPGGRLFIQVPYSREEPKTDEDPTLEDVEERIRRFGQFDHVRKYGKDIIQRLEAAGFAVQMATAEEEYSPTEMTNLAIWNDVIFLCDRA